MRRYTPERAASPTGFRSPGSRRANAAPSSAIARGTTEPACRARSPLPATHTSTTRLAHPEIGSSRFRNPALSNAPVHGDRSGARNRARPLPSKPVVHSLDGLAETHYYRRGRPSSLDLNLPCHVASSLPDLPLLSASLDAPVKNPRTTATP